MTISKSLAPALCALLIVGCGDDDLNEASYIPPADYSFTSRTNLDLSSSVSNEVPIALALMSSELSGFIETADTNGVSASTVLERLQRFFSIGTSTPDGSINISLGFSNAYTGINGSPTPINLLLDAGITQQNFADLTSTTNPDLAVSTNLSSIVVSPYRVLPFTTMVEVEGYEDPVEVGEFIGWPLADNLINGDSMPLILLNEWIEEVSSLMTDSDLGSSFVNSDGLYLNELISALTLGATGYSSISQYNLVSNKGLVKENTLAFNYNEVEEQLVKVEESEVALQRIEGLIVDLEELIEKQLQDWLTVDPSADPGKGEDYYDSLLQYGPISYSEAYFKTARAITNREISRLTAEERIVEMESLVDAYLPYTSLSLNWDEAFGYFGASRNYGYYTDSEITVKSYYDDVVSDGSIDIFTEISLGYSVLASRIDASAALENTDFSSNIWNAFLMGRHIIQQNHGLEAVEFIGYQSELKVQSDIIIENMEKVIAASIIHHINETIDNIVSVVGDKDSVQVDVDLSEFDSFDFVYYKNWSKLKGMALTLQFNDTPIITKTNFASLHEFIGGLPVPENNNYAGRIYDLEAARNILRDTYGFEEANALGW